MATITWVGDTSSAWGTGANWSGGAEPSNDDTVYIDGTVSIDGVDKSAVHLDALIIRETYTGQFGTSAANPVKIAVDGECSILGGSAVYINSGASNPIVNLLVSMPVPQRVVDIGGTVTYGQFLRGTVTSAASYTGFALEPIDDNPFNLPQTTLTGGTLTTADISNATLWITTATTLTTANFMDATCWNYAGTFTTVNCVGRFTNFKHYHTATITTLNIKKGAFFDGSLDRRTKTITNVILHENSSIDKGNMTLTNDVKTPARLVASKYTATGAR